MFVDIKLFFDQKISDFGSFRHPPSEIRRHPAPNPRNFEILNIFRTEIGPPKKIRDSESRGNTLPTKLHVI